MMSAEYTRGNAMIDTTHSIEELENDVWGEPAFGSYIVTVCHKARKKPIKSLSDEEIRCLIGQKTGLRYLLPIAVEILQKEPLIGITYFEGDLLLTLLRLDRGDWADNPAELQRFIGIIRDHRTQIEQSEEIPRRLIEQYI